MTITRIMNTFYPKTSSRDDNQVEDWPDPLPLRNELQKVEPLHPSNFPVPYQDWIMDVSNRMQCPPDYVAVAAIVATAAVIGTACGIKPKQHDSWLVIPNLWGGLVGHPGKLKSPAVAEALKPLGLLEAEAKKSYDAELASYMADLELYKAGREALKDALIKSSKQASFTKKITCE